jgi:methionyl-tRNA formyltransferase
VRALDKIEAKNKADEAKDAVIAEQDKALAECSEAGDLRKTESEHLRNALTKQTEATDSALSGWKQDEKRVKELEKKLRKSDNKLKWFAAGGITAVVLTILLKR